MAIAALAGHAVAARAAQMPLVPRWSVALSGSPAAPPVSGDSQVYVALRDGGIVAYGLADGVERWRRDLATDQPLALEPRSVFVVAGGGVHALRAEDGASRWSVPQLAPAAPLLARAGWLIVATEAGLVALRTADGAVVWRRNIGAVHEQPAIDGDRVYAGTTDGRVVALDVRSGTPVWEQHLGGPPGAILAQPDRVFAGASDRQLYCLKAVDGRIDWQWRIGALVKGRPAADDARVYFAALDNVLHAQDRETGVQKWRTALDRRPDTGPLLSGDAVVVPATSAELWRFDADTGRRAASIHLPGDPAVSPEVVFETPSSVRVLVVTGGLSNEWKLMLLAMLPDLPLVPLSALPGQPIPLRF